MAFVKRTYVDQTTIITAENLNDIQDAIIANGLNIDKHSGVFADAYDATATYAVGDYCTYEDVMYKCTTAIVTAEDWTAAHWTEVTVGDELIAEKNVQSDWNEADNTKPDYIKNKPTIPAAQVNSDWDAVSGVAQIMNKPSIPIIDSTLSTQGQAADAKATGDKITEAEQIMSYLETGNTASRNYSAGEYVNWKGVLYTVNTGGISSGASFVAGSGGNLSAVGDGGGLNSLKNTMPLIKSTEVTVAITSVGYFGYYGDTALPVPISKVISIFQIGASSNSPCIVSVIGSANIRCSFPSSIDSCKLKVVYIDN